MGRRTHSGCDPSESWHDRVGHRRKSSRSERIDHLSLRRWWPLRPRRRQPAKDELQKRPLDGRRFQSLESRRLTDDKIARGTLVFGARNFLRFAFEREQQTTHLETDRSNWIGNCRVLYFGLYDESSRCLFAAVER